MPIVRTLCRICRKAMEVQPPLLLMWADVSPDMSSQRCQFREIASAPLPLTTSQMRSTRGRTYLERKESRLGFLVRTFADAKHSVEQGSSSMKRRTQRKNGRSESSQAE